MYIFIAISKMLNVKWKVAQYNVHEQTVEWYQVFISMQTEMANAK
jgi:hypothetical protein